MIMNTVDCRGAFIDCLRQPKSPSAISFVGGRPGRGQHWNHRQGGQAGSGGEPAGFLVRQNHRQERNARAPVAAIDHNSSDTSCRSIVGTDELGFRHVRQERYQNQCHRYD